MITLFAQPDRDSAYPPTCSEKHGSLNYDTFWGLNQKSDRCDFCSNGNQPMS